jgi:CheY-like chemotaxis protein
MIPMAALFLQKWTHGMAEPLTGIRVLVVEDNEDNRFLITESLRFQGALVESVSAAHEAADMLDGYDIIVTDYAMPDRDGVWLLEQAQHRVPPVPVILLSGFTEAQREAIATAAFARKLLKPVEPEDLATAILKTLNRA